MSFHAYHLGHLIWSVVYRPYHMQSILIGQYKFSKGWAGYHFRRDFQNYVASKGGRPAQEDDQSVDDLDDGRVQTVGVIFNGRVGSLLAVKEMLIERIPIVVIGNG